MEEGAEIEPKEKKFEMEEGKKNDDRRRRASERLVFSSRQKKKEKTENRQKEKRKEKRQKRQIITHYFHQKEEENIKKTFCDRITGKLYTHLPTEEETKFYGNARHGGKEKKTYRQRLPLIDCIRYSLIFYPLLF